MNVQHAPTAMAESRERYSPARLQGRWLLLARGGWITLVVLTLAIYFASLPVYVAQLQTICIGTYGTVCTYLQLTPEQGEALKGFGLSPGDYAASMVAFTLTSVVVCLVVSTVIIWRRSHDRMALLVALMLVTFGPISGATITVPASLSPWQVPSECLYFLANALFALVFLLFPTGQFVPRWTRWTIVVFLAGQVPYIFFPRAPFTLKIHADALGYLMLLGGAAIVVAVQLYRYRRVSNSLQQQQTKWVVFGLAVPAAVFVGGNLPGLLFPVLASPGSLYPVAYNVVSILLTLFIPLSFGFAMLRYRLWEIDVLINRTLVYGTLTAILTGIYVGLVIGLQALLRGIISQDNGVAIVISTLAIYILFQPLRQRLQRLIDRRFYRSKYDAAKIIEAFSSTLRQEVDLDQLREHLLAVVQETMQPTHVSLWLRPPQRTGTHQAVWNSNPPASSQQQ
jgi:hypothetical protein